METLHTRLDRRSFFLLLAGAPFVGQALSLPRVAAQAPDDATVALMRGDAAQTGQMPGPAPAGAPAQLWFAPEFNGFGFAPLVTGNVVVALARGEDQIVGLDAVTGEELWRVDRGKGLMLPAAPAAADGLVYIGGREAEGDRLAVLLALDAVTGEEVWRLPLPDGESFVHEWLSPLVSDNVVYVAATTGFAFALDAATGEEIWRTEVGFATFPPPALAGGRLVFIHDDDRLLALDAGTGEEQWRGGIEHQAWSVSIESGLILAMTEGVSQFEGGELHAVDLETGEERWVFTGEDGVSSFKPPAVANGVAYLGGMIGTLFALDLETGEVRWQRDEVHANSPVIVGETLYVTLGDDLHALDAAGGEDIWSVEDWLGDNYDMQSSLVIADGRIFIHAGEGLAAFGHAAED
jgi:outer membrane protein assembly factor BamB